MSRNSLVLGLLALLAGCGRTEPHHGAAHGAPVLRAVYRDATHRLLMALPDGPKGLPPGDCAAPLLIDEATGGVRQLTREQAAEWLKRMQLSGAVHGTCP